MKDLTCNPCGKRITNDGGSASFPCPKCGKTEITRCKNCREIVAKYSCAECGFVGPN